MRRECAWTLCRVRDVVEGAQQQIDVRVEREVGGETARAFPQARMRLWISQARHNRRRQALAPLADFQARGVRCGLDVSHSPMPPTSNAATGRPMTRRFQADQCQRLRPEAREHEQIRAPRTARRCRRGRPIPVKSTLQARHRGSTSDAKCLPTRALRTVAGEREVQRPPQRRDRRRGSDCSNSRPPFSSSMRPTNSRRQGRLSSTVHERDRRRTRLLGTFEVGSVLDVEHTRRRRAHG